MNRTLFALPLPLLLLLLLLQAPPARAATLADEPDSVKNVLELNLARLQADEIAGGEVTEFRLYTTSDRSLIAWWREKTLYLYPVAGPDHEQRASALVGLLRQYGLVTFVAERKSKRIEGFNQVSIVKAFQVAAGVASTTGGKGSKAE